MIGGKLDRLITRKFSDTFSKYFHILAYHQPLDRKWLGIPIQKNPYDLMRYQEIIFKTKPDFIIETGTYQGGSALFFATIFEMIGKGKVITIDLHSCAMKHPRIIKLIGPSIDRLIFDSVKEIVGKSKNNMVVLDSDHSSDYVLKEMVVYSDFVKKGNYMVVEDTDIKGNPVLPESGGNPMEAVRRYMKAYHDFEIEPDPILTFFPNGWLKRK